MENLTQPNSSETMNNQTQQNASQFSENWVKELGQYINLLLVLLCKNEFGDETYQLTLICKVLAHHIKYYTTKWAATGEDVLAYYSPSWLNSMGVVGLWVTGWSPMLAFVAINALQRDSTNLSFIELSEEQMKKIQKLRLEVEQVENKVNGYMNMLQVMNPNEECNFVDRRIHKSMRESMMPWRVELMKMADCARLKTLKGLCKILSRKQYLKFLTHFSLIEMVKFVKTANIQ